MIAANEITVRYLEKEGFPSLRRILRSPERWDRIVELAARYHEDLPPEPDSSALQRFLIKQSAADPTGFPDLSLAIVKLMGRGEYVPVNPGDDVAGHFGLALSDYTHSTAPNRRYPDLVTQRLLKSALGSRPAPYRREELASLAAHCTTMEDAANKVERLVTKAAAALLLENRHGEIFDALVTGASPKGTWVRIFAPPVEGRVVHGYAGMDVGDKVRVKLIGTDVEHGFIDFAR
jgi:exoribonuclease-2